MSNIKKIPIVREGFINKNGQYFDKVKEIAFKQGELYGNLGEYITETKYRSNNYFVDDKTNGVYIYQSSLNPNIGYRLYKTFADLGFNGNRDDELIQRLVEKQKSVTKTKFPTGVITLDGNIVGQEIYFFKEEITLYDFFNKINYDSIGKIYYEVLEVLNEMYSNGVLYLDVHARNFMINPNLCDVVIDTIDFDFYKVKFDDFNIGLKQMFENYSAMINSLNDISKIDKDVVGEFPLVDNFDDAYKELNSMQKRLIR